MRVMSLSASVLKELIMRWKGSIISFVLTLTVGLGLGRAPSVVDWLRPSFSQEEAAPRVGHRVRYRLTEKFRGMKCPEEGPCKEVRAGEYGTVIGIEKVPDGGYFLTVLWDEPGGPDRCLSYFGRYTHRESLIEE